MTKTIMALVAVAGLTLAVPALADNNGNGGYSGGGNGNAYAYGHDKGGGVMAAAAVIPRAPPGLSPGLDSQA